MLDGRLDAATHAEVVRHLENCEECRREFEALRWTKQAAAKQLATTEAPAELREKILRAIRPDVRDLSDDIPRANFWSEWLRPVLGCAAILVGAAMLVFAYLLSHPGLPDAVDRDFLDYKSGRLVLQSSTGDVKEMEAFFAAHGIPFNTRVFDLGMMDYHLTGGRVQTVRSQPGAADFLYRGPANRTLLCRMYAGKVASLPPGVVLRENNGIKFHTYRAKGLTAVFWQEGAVVCVLVSDIDSEEVVRLAFAKAMI